MKRVPKKNISPLVKDIRSAADGAGEKEEEDTRDQSFELARKAAAQRFFDYTPEQSRFPRAAGVRNSWMRWLAVFVVVLVGIFVVFVAAYIQIGQYEKDSLYSASENVEQFQSAISDLRSFRPAEAREKLLGVDQNLGGISSARNSSFLTRLFENVPSFIQEGARIFERFRNLIVFSLELSDETISLGMGWPDFVTEEKGEKLLMQLGTIHQALQKIDEENSALASLARGLEDETSPDFAAFAPLQIDFGRLQRFAGALLDWLSSSERRLAVVFLNPSELRPGGGFIGSYADVTIEKGAIAALTVRDINEPDRTLDLDIVPPKPIQAVARSWRAADANWFFDFSQSSEKLLELLEASQFYNPPAGGDRLRFDGVVAITNKVAEDLLGLFGGSFEVTKRNLALAPDNLLVEIQKYVEKERSAGASYPKEVLREITALFLEKLSALDKQQREKGLEMIQSWLGKKDLLFYLREPKLQQFLDFYGWTGTLADISSGSDYLAVVNATLGGEKTELFVDQEVTLQSQFTQDGVVNNRLVIRRQHNGDKSEYRWYRAPNQAFIKVYTPLNVKLTDFSGGYEKRIVPAVDYEKENYFVDSLVRSIEMTTRDFLQYPALQSFQESERNVFGLWSRVARGNEIEITIDYERRLSAAPAHGQRHRFIFEKQAGSRGRYAFEIHAPIGFQWKENGLPIFEYATDDPDGKIVLDLTLSKI